MKTKLLAGIALGLGLAFSGAAQAQIKIGVAGPITGPNAAFGAQLKNGVEQAVEDINAAGGINGQKLQMVVGDDVSDPKQGVSVANKFAAEGKKVAVVHDKTPYGKGLADETQKAMNAKGLKEVVYEGVNTGEKDYSALVSKLKQAGVDVVYFGGLHTEAGLIIRP